MANVYFSCCSVLQIMNNLRVNNRFAVVNNNLKTHMPSPSSYTRRLLMLWGNGQIRVTHPSPSVHFELFKNRRSTARCLLFWCENSCKVGSLSPTVESGELWTLPWNWDRSRMSSLQRSVKEIISKSFQSHNSKPFYRWLNPVSHGLKLPDNHPCMEVTL